MTIRMNELLSSSISKTWTREIFAHIHQLPGYLHDQNVDCVVTIGTSHHKICVEESHTCSAYSVYLGTLDFQEKEKNGSILNYLLFKIGESWQSGMG